MTEEITNKNVEGARKKKKWVQLTDDNLQFIEGEHDELLRHIEKRSEQGSNPI